ncbi:DUF533 domain-containing protein [Acuticoccus sediminis]|uniref:DUF533 domain-containing protein n=1 Tax=Acuticoccus sediminis TaxID=2184697 RepID=A0A8B2NJI4_9HYPH|nr:DUF533 domain-containing protein [Acuticoccus sediminis]RAH95419.1 DUF533 domain-containing protein [Acuticoccus sediminis]
MDVKSILESALGSGFSQKGGGEQASDFVGGLASNLTEGLPTNLAGGLATGLIGGAAAGGLLSLITGSKNKRGVGGKLVKYGGLATIGGLAYKAYRRWQAKNAPGAATSPHEPSNPPPGGPFDVENDRDAAGDDFRLVLVRAMIAAAQSDGHIDKDEHRQIREQVTTWDLGPSEKVALYEYFAEPADAATIARLARTDEQRAEIYLTSALCIDPDTAAEQAYLQTLADCLGLPPGLRGYLDAEAEAARQEVA